MNCETWWRYELWVDPQFLVLSCRICRIICCWLSSQNQSFLFQPLDSQFEFDAISVHHNWCCFIVCFAATTKGGSTNLSLNCSPCQLIIFQLIDISFQHLFALIINHWFLNSHLVFYSTTKEILFSSIVFLKPSTKSWGRIWQGVAGLEQR